MAGPGSSSGPKTAPPTRDEGEMKGTVRSIEDYIGG